jgi:hypothetical protein
MGIVVGVDSAVLLEQGTLDQGGKFSSEERGEETKQLEASGTMTGRKEGGEGGRRRGGREQR